MYYCVAIMYNHLMWGKHSHSLSTQNNLSWISNFFVSTFACLMMMMVMITGLTDQNKLMMQQILYFLSVDLPKFWIVYSYPNTFNIYFLRSITMNFKILFINHYFLRYILQNMRNSYNRCLHALHYSLDNKNA